MSFCSKCGTKLNADSSFCHNCGAPSVCENDTITDNGDEKAGTSVKQPERITEFAGAIIKCPNCGEPQEAFNSRCEACGFEFRDTRASNSIKEFTSKLEAIDNRSDLSIQQQDKQKASVISSYVIPNNKEDIIEFMMLAQTIATSEIKALIPKTPHLILSC